LLLQSDNDVLDMNGITLLQQLTILMSLILAIVLLIAIIVYHQDQFFSEISFPVDKKSLENFNLYLYPICH
tara:strand:- start:518 stop:730 length:213 start_codon:yes stop_codon:yes gene_type:complete